MNEYKDSPDFQQATDFATFYMAFNEEPDIFQNANIRKAIQIGFDRDGSGLQDPQQRLRAGDRDRP